MYCAQEEHYETLSLLLKLCSCYCSRSTVNIYRVTRFNCVPGNGPPCVSLIGSLLGSGIVPAIVPARIMSQIQLPLCHAQIKIVSRLLSRPGFWPAYCLAKTRPILAWIPLHTLQFSLLQLPRNHNRKNQGGSCPPSLKTSPPGF